MDNIACPILSTLVYCIRDDRVLLIRRLKQPNAGLWVAPGGKLEPGEAPRDCAARELREETGLISSHLILRGVVREVLPPPLTQWLHFIYVALDTAGEALSDHREGELRWWPIREVVNLSIPQADRVFFAKIVEFGKTTYEARFEYDDEEKLVRATEYP